MNFRFTKFKTAISIIIGILASFYLSFRVDCIGSCGSNVVKMLGRTYLFKSIQSWIIFMIIFIVISLIIYLIWSLIQAKQTNK